LPRTSDLGQEETLATQQTASLFDHTVGAAEQCACGWRRRVAKSFFY